MNSADAIRSFDWTRYRTKRIVDSLPTTFIHKPIKSLAQQPFNTPAKILEHIAWAERMYIHFIFGGKSMLGQDFTFEEKSKKHILNYLQEIRQEIIRWLEERKEVELNDIMFNKRAHMGCVFHHLPEHEAHHVGQIVILALMENIKVPNV